MLVFADSIENFFFQQMCQILNSFTIYLRNLFDWSMAIKWPENILKKKKMKNSPQIIESWNMTHITRKSIQNFSENDRKTSNKFTNFLKKMWFLSYDGNVGDGKSKMWVEVVPIVGVRLIYKRIFL